jgi:RimJ/RimL family protein N-acetyltransferase
MTSGNTASYRTAEAIGMTRIKEFADDVYGNMYVYTITKEEWQQMAR